MKRSPDAPPPRLTVDRHFQHRGDALDALADLLYLLLVDDAESSGSHVSAGPKPTCFPRPPE
jgi:hypothetical protein